MKTVLITGIGGDISQGVATILRENRSDLRLVGIDIHDQHAGHTFVNDFEIVPRADDPGYLEAIQSIVRKYKVNLIIPMSEAELAVARPFLEIMPGVAWLTAGSRVVDVGLDKLETARTIEQLGLPVPWTIPANTVRPPSFPCILKSRFGSGSRAVFTVQDEEDLDYLVKRYPDAIFQEMLLPADREVTCAVYRTRDGRVNTLQMLRRLTGGFTGWAKVIDSQEVTSMCKRIAEGLDLLGSMNIQLRITDQGPRVFEINPRFSSTVLMRHRLGYMDVLWAMDEAEGKTVDFSPISVNKIMVRVQGALVFDEIGSGE